MTAKIMSAGGWLLALGGALVVGLVALELEARVQGVAAGLFAAFLVSRAWPGLRGVLTGVLLPATVFVVVAATAYQAMMFVSPPVTPDGHPVMPIAHVAIGGLLGIASAVVAAAAYLWRGRKVPEARARLEASLDVVAVGGLAALVIGSLG